MIRFNRRRISAPVIAAVVCAAVALLSYLALVAYDETGHVAFWN
jgi:hypothetical protein